MNENCPVCGRRPTIIGPKAPDMLMLDFVEKGLESITDYNSLYSLNVEMPQTFIESFGSTTWTAQLLRRMETLFIERNKKDQKTMSDQANIIQSLREEKK